MFPNVPLYPGFVNAADRPATRRRTKVFVVMTLNLLVCLLTFFSWDVGRGVGARRGILVPSRSFWQKRRLGESFWNKEQQRLDFINNPLMGRPPTALPPWRDDPGPSDPCRPDPRVPSQVVDYNSLPRRLRDFLLHMRCRTYPLLVNQPRACAGQPYLLLAVKSLLPHFKRRQAIRETWGRAGTVCNRTVATVFLLGTVEASDHFPDLRGVLGHESRIHKDLLQWDYRDSFFNLTLKEVLFHEWFTRFCPHARYVLKGDDDVFVNTRRVIEYLEGLSEGETQDLFVGDVISDAGPHRDPKLKYFIPESVFVGQYPPYAGGGGFLYSGQLALRLHEVSQQVALYPIDDVYTGMCLRKLGLAPEKHSGFRTFGIEEQHRRNPCAHRSLMLVHSRTPQELMKIWPYVAKPELDCQ